MRIKNPGVISASYHPNSVNLIEEFSMEPFELNSRMGYRKQK